LSFRAGGIAVAFIAIVGVPAVISQANQPAAPPTPTTAAAPAPKEATLVVPLSEAEKVGDKTGQLRIMAAGTPPQASTDLLSSDGREAVPVSALPVSACDGLPTLQALGQGATTPWCLKLDDISDGSQVAGKLAGAKTVLALTVSRRSSFCGAPLLAVVGGLLVGFFALIIPLKVRKQIRKGLVDKKLDENETREAGEKIVGLREWVEEQRSRNQRDDDILPLVDWVMREGPGIADRGRAELHRRLLESELPGDSGYRDGANGFLAEIEEPKAKDFFGDGKPTTTYPTDEWIGGLEKLERQRRELGSLEHEVEGMDPPSDEAKKALVAARRAFVSVSRPAAVDAVDEKLDALREVFPEDVSTFLEVSPPSARSIALIRNLSLNTFAAKATMPSATIELRSSVEPLPLRPKLDKLWPYRLITVALVGLAVLFAILSIEHTVFEPIADFGDYQDYFALVSASITAGVSSTVVALLSPWNSSEAAPS
jgi:hypothetical protein